MTRQVWHREIQKIVEMPFFSINLFHDYNHGLNNVDLSDQVRNLYRGDLFMRKRKWLWLILMWCLKILQDNAYILYIKFMTMNHLNAITHFEFNRQNCLSWIDPENYCPKKERTFQHQARFSDSTSITT